MKIRPVGAELFHADRHDEANSRFSQLCEKRPRKSTQIMLRPATHDHKIATIFAVAIFLSNKISLNSLRQADKNHNLYPVCCPEWKWQPAGQDSHTRVAEVERERGFLLFSVG